MMSVYFFGPHFDPTEAGSKLFVDDLADFTKTNPKNFIFESYSSGIGLKGPQ
jgi:hypothetical protein